MRVAVDTGGTFTDLIVEGGDGLLRMFKAPTTPDSPLQGVGAALEIAAADFGMTVSQMLNKTSMFIYGTTHALNAVVTGRTARTAFLTTQGHPDILVLREGGRPDPFDYSLSTPAPYVPRSLTWEISERVAADGSIVRPLDEVQVARVAQELLEAKVQAVAVCLLWSSIHPAHEQRVRDILAQHLPGVSVSISSEVTPAIREYRRASATAIDASLKPSMIAHLRGLEEFLLNSGLKGRLLVVTSRGGLLDLGDAAAMPIQMLNSGPAMAPVSGRHYALVDEASDFAIVADTGGTTYDVSVVRRGRIPQTRETEIESPIGKHITGFPSIDIKSVGAGGGSIAWVDEGGMLHVGPQSAGAEPGPAAYGKGGNLATLTDACLALGYLDPQFFLGGRRTLDLNASVKAIQDTVARPLQRSVEEAAAAIVQIATENMVQAIEGITVNQGVDPAGAVLIGGGGAAGLNSVWIAKRLGVKRLLIPEMGPTLSAAGAMMSDLTAQYRRTCFSRTDRFKFEEVGKVLADLSKQCSEFLAHAGIDGETHLSIEARYPDQVWEIEVSLPVAAIGGPLDVRKLEDAFHTAHEELFGVKDDKSHVEIVNWCATVSGKIHDAGELKLKPAKESALSQAQKSRRTYFAECGFTEAAVHRFGALVAEQSVAGPAIIESPFTTVVLPPNSSARKTAAGSLSISTGL